MTTESRQPVSAATPGAGTTVADVSVHVVRARTLLLGGLVGGGVAAIICLAVFGAVDGANGLISAGLAAAIVLGFYALGQWVMVLFADAGARTLLAVSMASYTTRVVLLGLLLLLYQSNRDTLPALVPMAIFVTTMAVVAGWLLVEVLVFSRLRIGHYDNDYVPPAIGGSDQ